MQEKNIFYGIVSYTAAVCVLFWAVFAGIALSFAYKDFSWDKAGEVITCVIMIFLSSKMRLIILRLLSGKD